MDNLITTNDSSNSNLKLRILMKDQDKASNSKKLQTLIPKPSTDDLKDLIIEKLDAEQAEAISIVDLEGKADFARYMVIASCRSSKHVCALADILTAMISKYITYGINVEGLESGQWVLIDVGDIIIHLFLPVVREHYSIEEIWNPKN